MLPANIGDCEIHNIPLIAATGKVENFNTYLTEEIEEENEHGGQINRMQRLRINFYFY